MALESERVLDSLTDHQIEEFHAEELEADIDQDYEQEQAEGHSQLDHLIKLTLLAAACVVIIYSGIVWYDKHQQVARELETVPPPPTVTTGSALFDPDKRSNDSVRLGPNSQQVSLQSIN